jgi:hypothetical protein
MTDAGQQPGEKQALRLNAETIKDLEPREDESAGLKGGFNPQPDPPTCKGKQ